MKVLVIGCGSIGQRHIRNLRMDRAGEILAFDADTARLKEVKGAFPNVRTSTRLDDLFTERPDAAVIAMPTSLHTDFALRAARAGCHIFIEKPLSHNLDGLDRLRRVTRAGRLVTFVGYNFRFHPSLALLKEQLSGKVIGKVVAGRTHFGSYLPERHPKRDYRRGYGARKSMGGGVILDALSHHLDYLSFLLGRPEAVFCHAAKQSRLEIDVEDVAEILVRFPGGAVVSIHGDFVQRPYKHTLELIGEEGTAACDLFARTLKVFTAATRRWAVHRDRKALNAMYRDQMRCFIACVRRKAKAPVDLEEGIREMKILAKIKESAAKKKWVSV